MWRQSALRLLLVLLVSAAEAYPGNFALSFVAKDGDILRVPHESSMQGPLIDSFTVELWIKVEPNSQLDSGRIVNLVGFPGRHPFVGLAADTGCAIIQLKTESGSWYSYEGTTPIDDGLWHHVAATWDGTKPEASKRELALYVDGTLESAGGEDDDSTDVPKTPVCAVKLLKALRGRLQLSPWPRLRLLCLQLLPPHLPLCCYPGCHCGPHSRPFA